MKCLQYLNKLKNKASHQKVVAIGEIGLDYHYNFSDSTIQKKIFSELMNSSYGNYLSYLEKTYVPELEMSIDAK